MEAFLTTPWLDGEGIEIRDDASLTLVRDAIRALELGADVTNRAVLVASELGRNHLRHARFGEMVVRAAARGGERGVELVAFDRGSGMLDAAAALEGVARSTGTLGVGVASVRRLSTDVDIDVRADEGTRISARVFASSVPRAREVGVYGRPIAGEHVSGDHAHVVRSGRDLTIALCDGLGHGVAARAAADAAMRFFSAHADRAPGVLLEAAHAPLASTRGVVMAVAAVGEDSVDLASVGNIDVQIVAPRTARRFGGTSAVVGGRPGPIKARVETAPFGPDDVLVITTDGITSKASIEHDLALLRAHPVVIAQRVHERFARDADDALVAVVR